jgi:hypothetical protein
MGLRNSFSLQIVKRQFPEDMYTLDSYVVRFDVKKEDPGVCAVVHNSEEMEENEWKSYIDNGTEDNTVNDVYMYRVVMHDNLYPLNVDLHKRH